MIPVSLGHPELEGQDLATRLSRGAGHLMQVRQGGQPCQHGLPEAPGTGAVAVELIQGVPAGQSCQLSSQEIAAPAADAGNQTEWQNAGLCWPHAQLLLTLSSRRGSSSRPTLRSLGLSGLLQFGTL